MKFSRIALIIIAGAVFGITWGIAGDKASKKEAKKEKEWHSIYDGSTLEGWKANERPESWTVKNGSITGDGPASHLFYMKEVCFNCEFKAQVKINHGGNSGMYFRTAFGPGFPKGYEAQVDNTHTDPKRTGSLYNFVNVLEQLIPDDTWWTQHIIVEGNHIQIFVNDKKTVDFIDEKNTYTNGYLALQQHNAGSVVEFKDLMMKQLDPPESPFSGRWRIKADESSVKNGDAKIEVPKNYEVRVLEERDGLRFQTDIVNPGNPKQSINFYARPDGNDYAVSGPSNYDHISIEQIDRKRVHEALKMAKLRKKSDDRVYAVAMKLGFKKVGEATYTLSADGKTWTREGTLNYEGKPPVEYKEVFEKVE